MPISIAAEEFFPQWRSLLGPPLKLQEVVRGVRPLPLIGMANLFNVFHLTVCQYWIQIQTIFLCAQHSARKVLGQCSVYSHCREVAVLTLQVNEMQIRNKTDPADRTQLRMTVASGTLQLKEFIKEQLAVIPTATRVPTQPPPPTPPVVQPVNAPSADRFWGVAGCSSMTTFSLLSALVVWNFTYLQWNLQRLCHKSINAKKYFRTWQHGFVIVQQVGDPTQLPATVISDVAKNHGYGTSLFERLMHAAYPVKC
ncbi:hypothetical protein PIB30_060338 [Stylosanthes scabra]|uniref:Uncharacterized protein n=1 Tax=Stylosanthes scabra TaxID=79078 RepID=A0ABU6XKB9_9FABA|nr:hypothetical protein [Stylosanthes scabra]